LGQTWNDGLMNLYSDFFFNFSADWLSDLISECLVDFFFVIIHSDIRLFQMSDVPEHVNWIIQSHQEVVNLIGPFTICHDHFENERKERSDPVNEPTSSRFFYDLLPVGHNF
jgi:hypothetical protein